MSPERFWPMAAIVSPSIRMSAVIGHVGGDDRAAFDDCGHAMLLLRHVPRRSGPQPVMLIMAVHASHVVETEPSYHARRMRDLRRARVVSTITCDVPAIRSRAARRTIRCDRAKHAGIDSFAAHDLPRRSEAADRISRACVEPSRLLALVDRRRCRAIVIVESMCCLQSALIARARGRGRGHHSRRCATGT